MDGTISNLRSTLVEKYTKSNGALNVPLLKTNQVLYNQLNAISNELGYPGKLGIAFQHVKRGTMQRPVCYCGKTTSWKSSISWYKDYCSTNCAANSTVKKSKIKNTCMEKYGVTNPSKLPQVRQLAGQTMRQRYGSMHARHVPALEQQRQTTMQSKFGVTESFAAPVVREKSATTMLARYGVKNASQRHISTDSLNKLNNIDWLVEENQLKNMTMIAHGLNVNPSTVNHRFSNANVKYKRHSASAFESSVVDYIKTLGVEFVQGDRSVLGNYELDIYVPESMVAIECNGSYWHSELNGRDRHYHLLKTQACESKNVKLIHLWEHDWNNKQQVVKQRLRSKLGLDAKIYARKCTVLKIGTPEKTAFLEKTHIQGACSSSINYGLVYQNQLVAVMTFGASRFNKSAEYELLRYSSTGTVVGGAGKLFSAFVRDYLPNSVVSYADRMWNTGNLYAQLGFVHTHNTSPSYRYTKDYILFENRVKFQKHRLEKQLAHYNSGDTEWENMKNNGYDRIWDCGSFAFKWVPNE